MAVTLHDARHAQASFLIASGHVFKAITAYMPLLVTVRLDRYGHLMPDASQANAAILD